MDVTGEVVLKLVPFSGSSSDVVLRVRRWTGGIFDVAPRAGGG